MQQLRARVERVARTNFTVLVEGESGVGKELVAREIHARGLRCRGPFVAVNCAALVETLVEAELFGIEDRTATGVRGRRGKFELADQGTLFLDEVADLSPTAQAKLLRVLQDMTVERVGANGTHHVDTRVIVATNRNLHDMANTGQFRSDLYYRLAGVEIVVPPLRARRQDIPLLVGHFLAMYGQEMMSIDRAATEAMVAYDWPGNVRQLGRVLERAIALAPQTEITLADLPEPIRTEYVIVFGDTPGLGESLRAWSSRYVHLVLSRCQGNKRKACDLLDISYHTLQAHLAYGSAPARSDPALEVGPPDEGAAACDATA
jgi:transcriptional regulator with PAS, ATPase and Fis domain